MTALLASSTATSATATEGDVKAFLSNLRDVIAGYLGTDSANKALALATLGANLNGSIAKTSSYTVVEADRGKVITYSGSGGVTVSLSAVATLGDGFVFAIANNSSGVITLDPNLSEQINSATTYAVQSTETVIVFCDGAKWILFGKSPASMVNSFNTRTGPVTLSSGDITTALGFTPSANTHNHTGTYAPMTAIVGASYNGSNLVFTQANGGTINVSIAGG